MPHRFRIILILAFGALAAPLLFFARHEAFSMQLECDLHFDAARANAAKHAYAAGQLYGALRRVYVPLETAEMLIIQLGRFNEYAETIFKVSEPDSTAEIRKDLFNNQAGILAAEWARTREATLRDTVIRLAQGESLASSSYHVPMAPPEHIEDYPQSVRDAYGWFMQKRIAIRERVAKDLAE
jgi:hypothetical protein